MYVHLLRQFGSAFPKTLPHLDRRSDAAWQEDIVQNVQVFQQFEFLKGVVRDEDYATGLLQQEALRTGSRYYVMFGRNEEGGQVFHAWVEKILEAEDEELPGLFDQCRPCGAAGNG